MAQLLHRLVADAAAAVPNRAAIIAEDGAVTTFAQFERSITAVAGWMASRTARGDRVALIADNGADYATLYYAVPRAGRTPGARAAADAMRPPHAPCRPEAPPVRAAGNAAVPFCGAAVRFLSFVLRESRTRRPFSAAEARAARPGRRPLAAATRPALGCSGWREEGAVLSAPGRS